MGFEPLDGGRADLNGDVGAFRDFLEGFQVRRGDIRNHVTKRIDIGRGVGGLFITLKLETCNRQLVRKDPFIPRGPVSQWGFQSGWH